MIGLGRQLILTACIVNFGRAYHVQQESQRLNQAVGSRVNEDGEVQNDFQNLFESISKNDGQKSGLYRTILEQEIAREGDAFDGMKQDLRTARDNNVNKKRKSSGENRIVAVKREIANNTCSSDLVSNNTNASLNHGSTRSASTTNASLNHGNHTEEDKFKNFFITDPIWEYAWDLMSKSHRAKGETPLKKYCEEAHFRAGNGMAVVVLAHLNARTLRFRNEQYSPMKIDVVTYEIKDYGNFFDTNNTWSTFYITQGLRTDCVYFLNRVDGEQTNEYYLGNHVCGVKLHG